jgi:hypothetical protein
MPHLLVDHYRNLLEGAYDCVDRIVLNAYFPLDHSERGIRQGWRRLFASDDNLDNTHLMRLAGRFSRRLHAFAKAHRIPVIHCRPGERKHEIAEKYLPTQAGKPGLFLILVAKTKAPVWEVNAKTRHLSRKQSLPYVNHYSFHLWEAEWEHVTMKVCGHPPFRAQVILNGHEYVASRAKKQGIHFTKEGNCFTHMSNAAGLGRVADTLSAELAIGRLNQVCERWIHTCLGFALDSEEREQSGLRYQYTVYPVEYSRNLLFEVGGQMDQVFQALVECSRAPLDGERIKTILGRQHRPHHRRASGRGYRVVVVERPTYDLTVFKVHCGQLTLKIYAQGEHVLRPKAIAHHTRELRCRRSLPHFPEIVSRLREILERFIEALSCLDASFIADDTLERMPLPAQVGASRVGGIDFNRFRTRRVAGALLALSLSPLGVTASDLARQVGSRSGQAVSDYRPRRAAYDLKKFRAKEMVRKLEQTRRYKVTPQGLRALAFLFILRDKVIKPLLAGACQLKTGRKPNSRTPIDQHYRTLQRGMQDPFQELGIVP